MVRSPGQAAWPLPVSLSALAQRCCWPSWPLRRGRWTWRCSTVPFSPNDFRRVYAQALLREILRRTEPEFGPWKLELAPVHMERKRLFAALKEGRLVNVTAYPVNAEWANKLKFVPVPIDMGVQSWRVALIDKRRQAKFRSLDAARLKQLRAGAGSAWVTVHSLQANGFSVVTGGNYEGLFDMLMAERFDYFPRGVNEIFRELETHRRDYPSLALEENFPAA
ncbi:hypothetical protein ACHMW6_28075 [Pseudoduganella sp. UC29_106]|uniref:hypothetical protein n=1 Tax=Pseudoduganella sp. UC29_106 TaxID=3374553 RepID=UPI003757776C